MPSDVRRSTHTRRPATVVLITLALAVAGCTTTGGSDGGSDGGSAESIGELDTAAAAARIQEILDEGSEPDVCLLGEPEALAGVLDEDFEVRTELTSEDNTDVDVFQASSPGDMAWVACSFQDRIVSGGKVSKLSIDAFPDTSVDAARFLEGYLSIDDATTSQRDFAAGTATTYCWGGQECLVWWEARDMAVAVTIAAATDQIDADAVTDAAQALISMVVTGLADGSAGTRFDVAEGGGDAGFDTAAAAGAAQDAIDQGDSLGDCPMGTPAELVAAAGENPLVPAGMAEGTDNGQVFSGGTVDITYCALFDSGADPSQIEDLRIDVAPGGDIDIDTYLDEEFVDPSDTTPASVDPIAGGTTTGACWDDDEDCAVFWQNEDLFIAIVAMTDGTPISASDVATIAEGLIPVAGANLAGS